MTVLVTKTELLERFCDWRFGPQHAQDVLALANEFDTAIDTVRSFVSTEDASGSSRIGQQIAILSDAPRFPGFYPWSDTDAKQSEVVTLITQGARLIYAKLPAKAYA